MGAQRRALRQRADRLKASRWIDATSKLSPPATEDKLARRNCQCLLVALSGHRDPVMRCPLLRSALDVSCQPCVINKEFKSMVFQYLAEHIPSNLRDARFPSSQSRRTLPFEQHRAQFWLGPFWSPPVPPRFTNFLASEICAKTFDEGGMVEGKARHRQPGFLFGSFLTRPGLFEARQSISSRPPLTKASVSHDSHLKPRFLLTRASRLEHPPSPTAFER